MKSVEVSAGTLEYREEGIPTGPPVVLLHGLLMNDTQWNSTLPLLPAGFRYLLPVLPMGGHRIPMREDTDLTMDGMIGIVADFLDALDLAEVTLVITDWGGPLLLTDAGRDKRIARLVICPSEAFDNFPPAPAAKVLWLATRTTGTVAFALRQMRIGWLRRQRMMFGQMSKKPVPQDIFEGWTDAALADRRIRRDLIRYCRTRFDKADLIRATNALAEFTGPALVLWSDNPVMPAAHGQRLADLLPKGQLRHIADARVLIMLDQPEQTAAEIGRFLTQ
ncbi:MULTISPECIES: alpha/beta fold hydrolase [unclassified Mycolicibacterium]|uniref:alpha/beta fold hydrolase n=1 Tax=unclassified Mycolicibacterium TaxID=2636767 RepID=UPI0012DC787F|nr:MULTISPECIES: alpha/beta hydrolase [unclassified Mycolicibacterium]MUL80186.1 alpha/beta hydrolase [Mycolicibacterium sp. CBMA 329]MUL85953.1 alpha/beta hydrolase [Mycolicibacterium sp. CBMA 331]MUM03024.1 alpha/beta hydrolase [Mycolicibacterium sp. CBMA 334]MUM26836.1 alpha/beta hydrolase [Mycolicibacterium sp. CBMA 295]MUM36249.1 alpha/beta hydrolase [Mycolicibacterium sp. CBMA 247]